MYTSDGYAGIFIYQYQLGYFGGYNKEKNDHAQYPIGSLVDDHGGNVKGSINQKFL